MNKVALITGGGRGIGFGISQSLAQQGYDLAICGVRKENAVADALKTLRESGTEIIYCQADISETEAHAVLLDEIRKTFGRLNVLVNNAGVAPKDRKDLLEATTESFERIMKINLEGPYFLTQSVAKWMIQQQKVASDFPACIINISSISASVASPSRGDYCISKAGVSMATKLWAVRMAEFDIPVFEIRPGIVKTDMTESVLEKYDELIAQGLLLQSRWGLPEDVGKAAAMLASGQLPYSTGQVIMVDGGLTVPRL
ncbi:3-ketoacyl-ACP reductase [bacterium]|nr:3-ketoacyl-ACP reductase [bacterium]